jgi:polyhydroxyalkanoate synthase
MYAWYLRNMYLENNLRVPNKLHCCGQPIDLGRIRVPAYVFSAREDHIVPWRGAYASAQALTGVPKGALRFVLGASGHIAGTINSPVKNRRSYWVVDTGVVDAGVADSDRGAGGARAAPADPIDGSAEQWLAQAHEHPGSWWLDWDRWLESFSGGKRPAPKEYGAAGFPVIEPAPGRYVKERA